jgi:hypothetical protein
MAVRIHVTATMADQDVLRNCFREIVGAAIDSINIETTPPWSFFVTSVWGVASSKLIEGLLKIPAVGLQLTTEDASRWHLTLTRPGHPPQSFMHEFYLFQNRNDPRLTADPPEPDQTDPRLAFLEPDPDPELQRPWSQFDSVAENYAYAGVPIDTAFRDRVQTMDYGQAVNEFQAYETARMADALQAAGLQFERQKLIDSLLWNSVTDREHEADIDNLPSVLFTLGLRGSIAEFFAGHDESPDNPPNAFNPSFLDAKGIRGEEDDDQEIDEFQFAMEGPDDIADDEDEEISEEDRREIEEIERRMAEMTRAQSQDRPKRKRTKHSQQVQMQIKWRQDTFLSITRDAASAHAKLPIKGGHVELQFTEVCLQQDSRPNVAIGPYTLVKKLGSGTFATVWLAERTRWCIAI